jgi:hypothetical protein
VNKANGEAAAVLLGQLKAAFNAADRVPRLMVFFTDGCAACIEAARGVRQILEQIQPAPMVIVVWESVPGSGLPEATPTPAELALLASTAGCDRFGIRII